jgi:hypothetical protein
MGFYINPEGESKEQWLGREGKMVGRSWCVGWEDFDGDELPIILVDNGPFTAAGVAFDAQERDHFTDPDDPRPKLYFMVRKDKLFTVVRGLEDFLNKRHG